MKMTMIKNATSPLLMATLATTSTTRAFASPSLMVTRNDILQRSSPRRFYQNGNDDKQSSEIPFHPPPPQPMLPRVNVDKTPTATANTQCSDNKNNVEQPSVDLMSPSLPTPAVATKQEEEKKPPLLKSAIGLTQKRVKAFQKWKTRPGVKFRLRLGIITTASLAISGVVIPRFSNIRLLALIKKWTTHRGLQGIAALGRSVACIWALFVGCPRVLDRRAKERQRLSQEQVLERRRQQLHRLAGEVVRLRQELTSLDAEIRSFRREIISLKAYTTTNKQQPSLSDDNDNDNSSSNSNSDNNSEEIQKAINMEMGHLMQLRSDTEAALDAARQTWAEFRSKSPPEIWDDTLLPY